MSTNLIEDLTDLITQAEAARLRDCTRQAIAKLITQGRLQIIEVAGRKLVSRKQVLAFEPHPAGRKPAQKTA